MDMTDQDPTENQIDRLQKAHVQWEQQVARWTTRIAQVVLRLDRVGRLKKRLAFTPKRKSKNWRNGNFGSIIRNSPKPENG